MHTETISKKEKKLWPKKFGGKKFGRNNAQSIRGSVLYKTYFVPR